MTCLRGYPSVLLAPKDQHRSGYFSVEGLDLVGEALVGLGDLAIERVLSLGSKPGFDVRSERGVRGVALHRRPVAEQVVWVDSPFVRQLRDDVARQVGRPRRAVHENSRRPLAEHVILDGAAWRFPLPI